MRFRYAADRAWMAQRLYTGSGSSVKARSWERRRIRGNEKGWELLLLYCYCIDRHFYNLSVRHILQHNVKRCWSKSWLMLAFKMYINKHKSLWWPYLSTGIFIQPHSHVHITEVRETPVMPKPVGSGPPPPPHWPAPHRSTPAAYKVTQSAAGRCSPLCRPGKCGGTASGCASSWTGYPALSTCLLSTSVLRYLR